VVEGFQYRFSTGWDFSTTLKYYDGTTDNMGWSPPAPSGNSNRDVGTKALEIGVKPNGQVIMQATLFWNNAAAGTEQSMPVWYNLSFNPNSSSMHPYNVYSPAVTGSTGQINSSTWVDINSMTADETKNDGDIFYAVSTDNRTSWGVAKTTTGVRKIVKNNSGTWQYNNHTQYGSETWVNGTTNSELATLQQALSAQAENKMNKAQLDGIADANHFAQDSSSTLDLMIAPFTTSGASPISDGVNINYDAEAIVREAQPGVDYIAEFPTSKKIKIKSLVDTNLKIRAQ
jgi:hypothetical protein